MGGAAGLRWKQRLLRPGHRGRLPSWPGSLWIRRTARQGLAGARRRLAEVLGKTETELEVAALRAAQPDGTDAVHLRLALIQGLAQLPPRQRAVLVLRYWEQLSESEAADMLGCSLGTVKSSASRGLARLRKVTAAWAVEGTPAKRPLLNGVWS